YRTQINDLLLTSLVQTTAGWTESSSLLIDLEGHGREEVFDDLDFSRTVGWFTAIFPVRLNLPCADHPDQQIKAIKEQLRRFPHRGLGYGVLRYLNHDESVRGSLRNRPRAQISFNFLGHYDQALSTGSLFGRASASCGLDRGPSNIRGHLIEVTGAIIDG